MFCFDSNIAGSIFTIEAGCISVQFIYPFPKYIRFIKQSRLKKPVITLHIFHGEIIFYWCILRFFLQFTCQNITHLSMLSHRAFMIYKYTYQRCEKKRCSRLFLLRLINIDNYSLFSIFKPSSNLFVPYFTDYRSMGTIGRIAAFRLNFLGNTKIGRSIP